MMSHSCCPGKASIVAPMFTLKETLRLHGGNLEVWDCQGCRTIVHIYVKREDELPVECKHLRFGVYYHDETTDPNAKVCLDCSKVFIAKSL